MLSGKAHLKEVRKQPARRAEAIERAVDLRLLLSKRNRD
jgi:DNA-binding transcriptional regulator YdaS (Cro superfamily)